MPRIIFMAIAAIFLASTLQAQSISRTKDIIAGSTAYFFEAQHGTQIEYYAENGRLYLWYPGNRRIVQGAWKVEKTKSCGPGADGFYACKTLNTPSVCYKYPSNSYNPVTQRAGGHFECETFKSHRATLQERVDGDIFGLSKSKRVPFRLGRAVTSFNDITAKIQRK